ncbi:MAG: glutamine--tRNA ligase/YqeY domain fusion protein [Myxococcota bacterium]
MAEEKDAAAAGNFVRDIITGHLDEARYSQVVTRFPPEPNGYLHIGHAKAICLDFGMAKEFGGRCHLRMDDTNPLTEETEYVEAIKRDIRWLGFDWGDHFYFASDRFDQFYDFAVQLINDGKAYVDSQTIDEIRENRGTVTQPGTPSPFRDRSADENLALLKRMRAGDFPDGAHVVRAKIDMSHPNMQMRDPLLYRIRHATHHRTGDDWCIYPMYDFAHCLTDAMEGVTHSLCTLEFENNRDIYDWVLEATGHTEPRTHQYEFARLEFTYTITSKRRLLRLVKEGHVSDWDDPRMPTLAGVRRRGIPAEAIVDFCARLGVSKANSVVDIAQFEHVVREHLNRSTPRVMAVLDPLKIIIDNYPTGQTELIKAPFFPEGDDPDAARLLPFSRELYIEREDFMEDPPKKFYRLAPGREVRLRWAYFITCVSVDKDADGNIVALHCTYDPDTSGGNAPDGRKVKATLHWVSAERGAAAPVRLYERLFNVEQPLAGDGDFIAALNPNSLKTVDAIVEPFLLQATPGTRFQFERKGYFISDTEDSAEGAPVFNRIVTLKDAWKRIQKRDDGAAKPKQPKKPKNKPSKQKKAPLNVDAARAEKSPELAARFDRFRTALKLSDEDAHMLTDNDARAAFFEAAIAAHSNPQGVANWINNELMATLKDQPIDSLPFNGTALGALVRLIDEGVISTRIAKTVLEKMLKGQGAPAAIVEKEGLKQLSSPEALHPILDQVFAANEAVVAQIRGGDARRRGFLMGQIMKASQGRANPQLVNQLLDARLIEAPTDEG